MTEFNYQKHKWVKRLVDFNNNPFAKTLRDEKTVQPMNLCQLFWTTIVSSLYTIVAFIGIAAACAVVATVVGAILYGVAVPITQLFMAVETSEIALALLGYGVVGLGAIQFYRQSDRYLFNSNDSFWHEPISDLLFYRTGKPSKEIVEKDPSMVVEYIKGVKNKVCPIIRYN